MEQLGFKLRSDSRSVFRENKDTKEAKTEKSSKKGWVWRGQSRKEEGASPRQEGDPGAQLTLPALGLGWQCGAGQDPICMDSPGA